uniref:pollen-specific leucine-rich repeat extensin-like protein 1 n=1 Tax=Fragaria vesca subsp. vesca TaxID=101020 RepID=UPI0005C8DDD4|nr:PREDICTED: pollen-specific leucine-rich repeat extensin-like protein 1 [Fragaria vesca subsp. vesca]
MASQPARPWFRLSSMVRPAANAQTPTPAPAPAPAPLVRPTSRPLAPPPPAEPTPPPPAARAPTPPPAPVPTPTPPRPAAPTPTPPRPVAVASAPLPPLAVTSTTASAPSSPARGIYSAPSAASPPATSIAITSSSSSSVPPSPGNKVTPTSTSGMPSPRNRITTSLPNSPASRAVPPPQTSPPKPTAIANLVPPQTYSPPKPRSTTISSASSVQEPSPNYNPSPRTTKPVNNTPPQSPNRLKPIAPPPSPLNLPPSQLRSSTADQTDQRIPLEAEQKTVLVQKTIDQKPNSWFSTGGSKQDHDFNHESQKPNNHGHHAKHEEKINRKKLSSDSEVALGIKVITLAGENKGAYMELIRSPNKHREQRGEHNNGKSVQTAGSHHSDKTSSSSSSSGNEDKPKMKDKSHRRGLKVGNSSQLPLSSFTNSNVQGINNSILYNSSCTHHDPGVHLALTRKPNGDGLNVKSHVNGHHR